ncbi:hypothetical protein ColLi_12685 [Colletotrichum liriopes]|uniref:Uncharacterized protein n=1 Tax=Colletotrichum liriopes TaxID=708192 RepID=A0AA37LYW4_9PEZI|nr:hypothetical protein ColLi_12685 [Colletotrichum liriopes]
MATSFAGDEPIRIAFADILEQLRHSISVAVSPADMLEQIKNMPELKRPSKLESKSKPNGHSRNKPKPSHKNKSNSRRKSRFKSSNMPKSKSNHIPTGNVQMPSKIIGGSSR